MKRFRNVLCMTIVIVMLIMCASACTAQGSGQDESAKPQESEVSQPSDEETEEQDSSSDTITITDHADNTVILPKDIERIAVCDIYPLPSVLAIFFDSANKIVGMAENSMAAAKNSLLSELYPEILDASTGFMDGTSVNTEELIKLEPDIVFYSASDIEIGEQLRTAGFNAVAISVNKWNYNAIETLNNWISLLSQIFPDNDKAEKVESYSNSIYEEVQKRVASLSDEERERVFFLFQYTDSTISTSGKQFFGQWWAEAIGAVNVAQELTNDNSVQVNMEQIYAWNPELIFITNFNKYTSEDLYGNTVGSYDWSGVKAVSNQRVYKMPLGMYRSYTSGVDTPITLFWLAKSAYPELFSDIDITSEVKSYYSDVFGVELTDEQAESIFTPTAEAGASF